jgi:alpha-L-fucosidase
VLAADSIERALNALPSIPQLQWQRREVEVLIHYGVNTFSSREWGTGREDPSLFAPSQLSCDQWVAVALELGAKGVILVCKHHDGFCLWPSKVTRHSIKSSPWKSGTGDVVRELSTACQKAGMAFGVYLSPADLHEPSFGRNSRQYNDLFCNQLRELLTEYGEISQVFFDGANPPGRQQGYDFPRYYRLIRELQPNAVISIRGPDVRWVGNEMGKARESEWSVIPIPKLPLEHDWPDLTAEDLGSREKLKGAKYLHWYPAVADVSLRQGWFWQPNTETTIKSVGELVRIYEDSVGRNAGLQLNIAPDRSGRIPEPDVKRLKEFGDALRGLFGTNLLATTNATIQPMTLHPDGTGFQLVRLRDPMHLRYVVLQEDITKGQRVEDFEVIATDVNGRNHVFSGTTIGWKRILRINVETVQTLLVTIKQSRHRPIVTLSAF